MNHSKIFQNHLLQQRNTNPERITNTNVDTIHIIRSKKSSMDSKNNKISVLDQIHVELIKYSLEVVYKEMVACIYIYIYI